MKIYLAKTIFLASLSIMKKILDLGEFKLGKKSEDFQYFRKQVMEYFYGGLKKLFKQLSEEDIIIKCDCKSKLRQGYSDCPLCGGSGYRNKENKE